MKQAVSCKHRQAAQTIQYEKKLFNSHLHSFEVRKMCQGLAYLFEVLSWKFILSQPYVGRIKMKTYELQEFLLILNIFDLLPSCIFCWLSGNKLGNLGTWRFYKIGKFKKVLAASNTTGSLSITSKNYKFAAYFEPKNSMATL